MPKANPETERTQRTGNLILPPEKTADEPPRRKKKASTAPTTAGTKAYLLLIVLVLAVFSPLLSSDLIWSEHDTVERSNYKSMEHWQEAWSIQNIRTHDPISPTTYFLEEAIPLPRGPLHRSINLLLHLCAAILLLKNLEALKFPAALAATLVFALHPSTVQTIFWSGYRTELIGLILILSALYFGVRNRSASDYAYTVLLTIIAILVHPAALGIPLIIALTIVYSAKHHELQSYNRVLPLLCICLFMGVWIHGGGTEITSELTASDRLNQAGQNMSFFTRQALIPVNLALFHPFKAAETHSVGSEMSLLPFFLFIPFYVLIAFNIRKIWSRALLLGLTSYLVLIIYAVNQPGQFISGALAFEDHGQYIALPTILALIVIGMSSISRKMGNGSKALEITLLSCLIFIEIMLTASFTYAVSSPTRMWQSISEQWPNSWQTKVAYVESIQNAEEETISNNDLIDITTTILKVQPDQVEIRKILLRIYLAKNQNTNALSEYRHILRGTTPSDEFLEEAAQFYARIGLDWDAKKTRQRKQAKN
jgi:hypothetical protein